jgi:osmoprotectant transport system permease protein
MKSSVRHAHDCLSPRALVGEDATTIALQLVVALVALVLSCAAYAQQQEIRVGSKRFTESYILGEIVAHTVNAAGEGAAVHKQGLGNTAIVFTALQSGAIDIYPEYTGTLDKEILKNENTSDLAAMQKQLAAQGLGVDVLLGFNNTYALAMREEQAQKLGVRTLSDLAKHSDLKLGLSQEFIGRADGWEGLQRTYALPFAAPQGIDHGLAYDAIGNGQIDVTDIYSTDAKIEKLKLRVLEDDKAYFPKYDAVLLYRLDLPQRFPKTWAALQRLARSIDDKTMIHLNAEAELVGKDFPVVAKEYLSQASTAAKPTQAKQRGFMERLFAPDFWRLTWQHLALVFASLAGSVVVGVPLGIWAARRPGFAKAILSITGVVQTIPSLALLAFLIPVFNRIGTVPALVALFLYALLPIVRNTYAGLTQIAPSIKESALALGLKKGARLRLVELPMAMGTILAGIKTSAVINVGTATIAAFIGAGGYGERIVQGLALNDNATLLAGAVPAAVLALLVQWGFDLLDRRLISEGLR